MVPRTEGQQLEAAAAVNNAGGGDEVVPKTEGQQRKAATCRGSSDGLMGAAGGDGTVVPRQRGSS